MTGSNYPESPAYYDALLAEVEANSDLKSLQQGMNGWQTFGAMMQSVLRGAGETDSYAASDPLMPESLGILVQNHLSGWTGAAHDEFTKMVGFVADFGQAVGMSMYDQMGENPPGGEYPASYTFHRCLSDLQDTLNLITEQRKSINTTYNNWVSTLANNIYGYSNGMFGASDLHAGLPSGWPVPGYNATYDDGGSFDAFGDTSGTENFEIWDNYDHYTLSLPGQSAPWSGDSVDVTQTSINYINGWLTQHFTGYYKSQLGPLADLITSATGSYSMVGKQLPTKVDESFLPKGKPSSSSQNGNGSGGGGFFSGSGGFPGGVGGSGSGGPPGGGSGGTGSGGLPGGGSGGTGSGGLPGGGSGGTGSGGLPGGGSGGLGGGGLPGGGGTGSGGLPGGGPTKIAGVGPGGPGGIGPLGGGGGGAGGLAGGAGSAGLGGSGSALGSAAGAGPGGLAAAAGTNGAAMPLMPPMIPPMMGASQNDNNRQRKSWLPDDEDIWSDDGTAVPPVISSDG